jgi:hypothetical protein
VIEVRRPDAVEPRPRLEGSDDEVQYEIGPERGPAKVDSEFLPIRFDKSNGVVAVRSRRG